MINAFAHPPIHDVAEQFLTIRSSKWTVVVVLHLRSEVRRFSELHREVNGISHKALSATLRALERDGLVSRTSYPTIPPRVEYALTNLGREALKLFEAWEVFAAHHWETVVEARRLFDLQASESDVIALSGRR